MNESDINLYLDQYDDASVRDAMQLYRGTLNFSEVSSTAALLHVLMLLALKRYGYLSDTQPETTLSEVIKAGKRKGLPYWDVFESVETRRKLQPDHHLNLITEEVLASLHSLYTESTSDHFPAFFEEMLRLMSERQYELARHYTGEGGTSLLTYVVDLPEYPRVYNPFAGLASIALDLPKGATYLGQETNGLAYDIAQLRLLAHDKYSEGRCLLEQVDSTVATPDYKQFDLVVAAPPFKARLADNTEEFKEYRTLENWFIGEGIKLLAPKGKLVALVRYGFLFGNGSEKRLRKKLVDQDLIETIVSVPTGMINGTAIKSAIVVINPTKILAGKIKMVSPTSVDGVDGSPVLMENDLETIQLLTHLNEDSDITLPNVRIITNEVVREEEYDLSTERYQLRDVRGTALGDVLTIFKGKKIGSEGGEPIFTIRDLLPEEDQKYKIEGTVARPTIKKNRSRKSRPTTFEIDRSALLIATVGKRLKPTYYSHRHGTDPLSIAPQVKAFRIDRDQVDAAYLVHQLRGKEVQRQLSAYQRGNAISHLSVKDFLRIKIHLPSLSEQKTIVHAIQESEDELQQLRRQVTDLERQLEVVENTRFAELKHTLGRPTQNILSTAEVIIEYLDGLGKEGIRLNQQYADFYEQAATLTDDLASIVKDVDFISTMLDRGENGLQVEKYPLMFFTPLNDVVSLINDLKSRDCKFKLISQIENDASWRRKYVLHINLDLLRVMFDNLITNADKHGFDNFLPSNLMTVDAAIVDNKLILDIRNNGKPFPPKFGQEQFIQEFKTTDSSIGQGIGGAHINRIANYLGCSDWTVTSNHTAAFPVAFHFSFPVIELSESDISTQYDI
ncbi:N-6 DNA methylase [Lewinella sp. 4G2]|uniref:N-6 DNA methylase n=1 Tax=Lewinella sp. 4G2 TaxID=1803372 RepID=UPI0007B4EC70|nr:N-6 DNA methylase [Lewinella sp. 4G2]OAV43956.1 hypothetical protein A3850_005365 [Lewinella sp. 4G2]